jgi:hypothetical protein
MVIALTVFYLLAEAISIETELFEHFRLLALPGACMQEAPSSYSALSTSKK